MTSSEASFPTLANIHCVPKKVTPKFKSL